jgi:hypothetical protein
MSQSYKILGYIPAGAPLFKERSVSQATLELLIRSKK